jgi:hypothetical protein
VDEVVRLLEPEATAKVIALARRRAGEPADQLCMDAEKMKRS